jgi:hypothetical protein
VLPIVRLTVCFILLAEAVATRAADQLATKSAGEPPPARQVGLETAWSNPENYLRPHKGVRFEHGRSAGPMLLWVLCSPNGQPLAISSISETKVDDYFRSRLAAKLAEVTNKQILLPEQIDKLLLAAKVDLARLTRLAQRADDALRNPKVIMNGASITCYMRWPWLVTKNCLKRSRSSAAS